MTTALRASAAATDLSSVDILGVKVSTASFSETARDVVAWATRPTESLPRFVSATSVHGLIEATGDPLFREILNGTGAEIGWVGLSTPKQERWIAAVRARLSARVVLSVGAAFDFHTGRVRQAPQWMQARGLEWLFRLSQEPRRLWRRYAYNNPRFLWLALLQLAGLRKFTNVTEVE